jgi:hypothetical protein
MHITEQLLNCFTVGKDNIAKKFIGRSFVHIIKQAITLKMHGTPSMCCLKYLVLLQEPEKHAFQYRNPEPWTDEDVVF